MTKSASGSEMWTPTGARVRRADQAIHYRPVEPVSRPPWLADLARELGMKPESAWQGIYGAASWFARVGIVLRFVPPELGEQLCAPLDGVRLRLTDSCLTPALEIAEEEIDGAENVAQTAYRCHPGAAEWDTRRRLVIRNILVLRRILVAGDRQHGRLA